MKGEMEQILDSLREMLGDSDLIARGHAERTGNRLVCTVCDAVPQDILAAFGITVLRVKALGKTIGGPRALGEAIEEALEFCERVIVPTGCSACENVLERFEGRVLPFALPRGYGEDAAVELHGSLDALLHALGIEGIDRLCPDRLARSVELYDAVRRLARGISSLRQSRWKRLSQMELMDIFEAISALPPETVTDHLAGILEALNGLPSAETPPPTNTVLVRAGFIRSAGALDEMERAGCVVVEDDSCNGRRQFDISHNAGSRGLYYEMLDALSYRPLCPSLRPADERFNLLYRDLKNHGVGMVVFLRDTLDRSMTVELDSLRVRLMRSGIDPFITESGAAFGEVAEYLAATGTPWP